MDMDLANCTSRCVDRQIYILEKKRIDKQVRESLFIKSKVFVGRLKPNYIQKRVFVFGYKGGVGEALVKCRDLLVSSLIKLEQYIHW